MENISDHYKIIFQNVSFYEIIDDIEIFNCSHIFNLCQDKYCNYANIETPPNSLFNLNNL